ncbi:MAG: sugar nucleotide-binding protein [Lachnospiraceae bacterium]|nr:sugar nucleotide-binding protein [Lachnospiraceae bacterium]
MCQPDAYTGRLHHILRKLLSVGALFATAATAYTNIKRRVTLQDTLLRPDIDSDTDSVTEESEQIFSPDETLLNPGCKRILITGAHSYIGTSVEAWLLRTPDRYQVDTLDMKNSSWRDYDFSGYDVVFHVAGIAHSDVGDATEEQKRLYYQVNTDLAVETAQKAKNEGVGQFIFMSSMIIYSGCGNAHITADTIPNPLNFYGDSKWQADCRIRTMEDEHFKVVVLRPPMIYGKGSKGNYPLLAKMAGMLPVFPVVRNKRSMLYIENLCRFVQLMIDNEESGIFFPQNGEYTNTSDMVQMIANARRHRMLMLPFADIAVRLLSKAPGKIGALVQKAFGDYTYDMDMSEYREDYRVRTLAESIRLTETLD